LRDGFFVVETELAQFVVGSEVSGLAILALVLALRSYESERRGGLGGC
jgi:hypothetical protein